jgi:hypothetical protein
LRQRRGWIGSGQNIEVVRKVGSIWPPMVSLTRSRFDARYCAGVDAAICGTDDQIETTLRHHFTLAWWRGLRAPLQGIAACQLASVRWCRRVSVC